MVAVVVLAVFVVLSVAVSFVRARRHGVGDSITRHGRALETLRDIYAEGHPDQRGVGAGEAAGVTSVPGAPGAPAPSPVLARPRSGTGTVTAPDPGPYGPLPARTRVGARARGVDRRVLTFAIAAIAVLVAAVVAVVAIGRDDSPQPSAASTTAPTTDTTTTTIAPTTLPPTTAPLLIADRSGTPTVVVTPPFTLVITATGTSWTQVRDANDANLFVGTMRPGDSQTIDATGPVTATFGNAAGVALTVNGMPLDTSTLPATTDLAFVAS